MERRWTVTYKRTFLKELARLPTKIRDAVERFAFETLPDAENPLALGLEKLAGYEGYYKVSFGDYRVGLKADKKRRVVELCRVLHRRDIYRYFP